MGTKIDRSALTGVAGDTKVVRRTVRNVDTADPLVEAWLTVKAARGDSDPGVVQKIITTTDVPGTGHIEDDGSTDGNAVVRFDLSSTDTTDIYNSGVFYDIQVRTNGSGVKTLALGAVDFEGGVTADT